MRAIGGRVIAPARETTLESDLASAHAIIHILLTRQGGETVITSAELKAARGSWLTAVPMGDGGITVRAR